MKLKLFSGLLIFGTIAIFPQKARPQAADIWYAVVDAEQSCKVGEPCPQAFQAVCVGSRAAAQDYAAGLRASGFSAAHALPDKAFQAQLAAGLIAPSKLVDCPS